jgi:magnesium-transporting ATPase (P-type)
MFWEKIYSADTNVYLMQFPEGDSPSWDSARAARIWVQSFFTWILLFTNFVPISLLVTMEMVKFFQAKFI